MLQQKYSRQREAIINNLKSRTDHPTADRIYMDLREEYPNLSLATVYRNLSVLAENGEILKIPGENSGDHFDGNVKPHYHFLCKKCRKVIDVHIPVDNKLDRLAEIAIGGTVEAHSTLFSGMCGKCSEDL